MKNIIKSGKVRLWAVGDMYAIEADVTATNRDLADAVAAEEELDLYRKMGAWN